MSWAPTAAEAPFEAVRVGSAATTAGGAGERECWLVVRGTTGCGAGAASAAGAVEAEVGAGGAGSELTGASCQWASEALQFSTSSSSPAAERVRVRERRAWSGGVVLLQAVKLSLREATGAGVSGRARRVVGRLVHAESIRAVVRAVLRGALLPPRGCGLLLGWLRVDVLSIEGASSDRAWDDLREVYMVGPETRVEFLSPAAAADTAAREAPFGREALDATDAPSWSPTALCAHIHTRFGGYAAPVRSVVERVLACLAGRSPARGVLIVGPAGVGKTTLVHRLGDALRSESVHCEAHNAWTLFGKHRGDAERRLIRLFRGGRNATGQHGVSGAASATARVLILDEVHAISRPRSDAQSITDLSLTALLRDLLDADVQSDADAPPHPEVDTRSEDERHDDIAGDAQPQKRASVPTVVLATAPSTRAVDPALLTNERLGPAVHLAAPSEADCLRIWTTCLEGVSLAQASVLAQASTPAQGSLSPPHRQDGKEGEPGPDHTEGSLTDADETHVVRQGDDVAEYQYREAALRMLARQSRGFVAADIVRACSCAQLVLDPLTNTPTSAATANGNDLTVPALQQAIRDIAWDVTAAGSIDGVGTEAARFAPEDPLPPHARDAATTAVQFGFEALAGLDDAIRTLRRTVLDPLRDRERYTRAGVRPARGVLLHGSPGTGKTMLARALATECREYCSFFHVTCAQLVQRLVGGSEKAISAMFASARNAAPALLLLDNIEAVGGRRGHDTTTERTMDRMLSTLLIELDGAQNGGRGDDGGDSGAELHPRGRGAPVVIVVATTGDPSWLDPALLRPGRLEVHLHLHAPDLPARRQILRVCMDRMALSPDLAGSVEERSRLCHELADMLEGRSGADLRNVCAEAAMSAVRRTHAAPDTVVSAADFRRAAL